MHTATLQNINLWTQPAREMRVAKADPAATMRSLKRSIEALRDAGMPTKAYTTSLCQLVAEYPYLAGEALGLLEAK